MARIHRFGAEHARAGAGALPAGAGHRPHAPLRRLPAVQAQHRLRQQHPARARAGVSRQPRARAPHRGLHPLECHGDGGAGESSIRANTAATCRATPPRRRSTRSASIISGARPPSSIPGDMVFIQGHSSPGIYARAYPRRAPERGAAAPFPPGSGRLRDRAVLLSASVADAGLLAVPDRVHGPRAHDGDLPGALHRATSSTAAW